MKKALAVGAVVAASTVAQASILTYQFGVTIDSTSFPTGAFAGASGTMVLEVDVESTTPVTFGDAFTSIFQSAVVAARATTNLGTESFAPPSPGNAGAQLTSDQLQGGGYEDSLNQFMSSVAPNAANITSLSVLLFTPLTVTPTSTFLDPLSLSLPLGPVDLSAFTQTRSVGIGGQASAFNSFSLLGTIDSLTIIVPSPGAVVLLGLAGFAGVRRRR